MCMYKQLMSHNNFGDLLIKRKHEVINCNALLSKEVADIIIPLHLISGSGRTSGFYGKQFQQKVIIDLEAKQILFQRGQSLQLDDEVRTGMTASVFYNVLR